MRRMTSIEVLKYEAAGGGGGGAGEAMGEARRSGDASASATGVAGTD